MRSSNRVVFIIVITVLSQSPSNITSDDERLSFCGANFCNQEFNSTESNKPTKQSIDMLSGILLGFALLATVVIAFLVDPLTR